MATGEAGPAPEGTPQGGWLVPLVVLVAGMFMSVLDISIVNVAIPVMQNDFGVTTGDIGRGSTSYSLAEGVIVPASAWLGLRLGLGRAYIVSMVGFSIGSALCGMAWNLDSMIAFRILQAIPGGVIPVVALSMLYSIVPRGRIGAAMGLYGLGIVFAPALGPTLGGYLVEYVDWRLIFFINLPIGVLGTVAALIWLPRFPAEAASRFDLPGFLAVATGAFSLLLALSKGADWGWTSYPTIILLAVGVLGIALFVVIELEVDHPLLDVRVFTSWAFSNSLVLIAVVSIGLFAVLFFVPVFLQRYQGLGAFDTGLLLLPQALVMTVTMPLAGRLYDLFGPRWPAVAGLVVLAVGTYLLHDVTVDTSHSELGWILTLRAAGMGLAMMPMMTGGISALPPERVSGGSAFNTVVQRTSSAMGLAALTAMMSGLQAQGMADRGALVSGSGPAGGAPAGMLGQYMAFQQMQTQVFVTALQNLMLATAALTGWPSGSRSSCPAGARPAEGPR